MADNIEYRIEQLEGDMSEVKTDVKNIMRNHLPHIETEITKLSTQVKIFGGLILSAVTALIIMGLNP